MHCLTIVGLGPGEFGLVTLEAWQSIENASQLFLRTEKHPSVQELKNRGIKFSSYDAIYETKSSFEEVYDFIVTDCLRHARENDGVVYAVPGSPAVAERTVVLLRRQAEEAGVQIRMIPGMSFLEVLYARLGVDPVEGITVLDVADLAELRPDIRKPLVVTQLYSRSVASDAKLNLMEIFPDEHPVTLVRNLSLPDEEILTMPLYELDRAAAIDHLTSLYIAPKPVQAARFTLEPLQTIMATLRSPGGCLWDIEQTHSTLRRYAVEEVYEVLEAIELAAPDKLCEELGDLLLQIVFHARIAEECGEFSMQQVIDGVSAKMIRRHPHVFGDISVRDAAEVVLNWDQIKKREKGHSGDSVLDGVPIGLPSLMTAFKLQGKAAKVGFDWDNIAPVWEKIKEELAELQAAVQSEQEQEMEEELGDVLFSVVNLARFLKLEPETALNRTNNKFKRRFHYIETQLELSGEKWEKCSLAQLDELWEAAKAQEIK